MTLLAELTARQLVLAAGGFAAVLSLWLIGVLVVAMRRHMHEAALARRLGEVGEEGPHVRVLRLWADGKEATTVVPGTSRLSTLVRRLKQFPEDAGFAAPAQSLLLGLGGVMLLAAALTYAGTRLLAPSLEVAAAVAMLFSIYTRYRIARNEARFEHQFANALQLLARSLRAGHPLTGAFRLAAEEMQPPVSHIFARICQEQSLGVDLEKSLRSAAEEHASQDLKLFATSVAIQLRTGGNLALMMDRLAEVIRHRIRLTQRVRVVSAQTQLSKRILLALPLLMLLMLSILNPAHTAELWNTSMGNKMVIAGGVAMLLGWYTMNRMARITY